MKPNNYIYKYRSYSNISLKEILYGELFLSAIDELNDPYDTNVNFIFYKNYDRYKRFINFYLDEILIRKKLLTAEDAKKIQTDKIIKLLNKNNLVYPDLIILISGDEFKTILIDSLSQCKSLEVISISDIFIRDLKQEIHKRLGSYNYISSFSKTYDEPIIWSHYSGYHTGFCLQFKPIDNKILSRNQHEKGLEIENIYYKKKIKEFDAFYNFNGYINNRTISKKKISKYWKEYKIATLTKSDKWKYEQEIRLSKYHSPEKVTTDGPVKSSIAERIFHYDQIQLTGIIFGSKMSVRSKEEVINTIRKMRDNLLQNSKNVISNFKIYESEIRPNSFKLNTNLLKVLDYTNKEFPPAREKEIDQKYLKIVKIQTVV